MLALRSYLILRWIYTREGDNGTSQRASTPEIGPFGLLLELNFRTKKSELSRHTKSIVMVVASEQSIRRRIEIWCQEVRRQTAATPEGGPMVYRPSMNETPDQNGRTRFGSNLNRSRNNVSNRSITSSCSGIARNVLTRQGTSGGRYMLLYIHEVFQDALNNLEVRLTIVS